MMVMMMMLWAFGPGYGRDDMIGTAKGGGARGVLRLTAILRAKRGSCQRQQVMVLGGQAGGRKAGEYTGRLRGFAGCLGKWEYMLTRRAPIRN